MFSYLGTLFLLIYYAATAICIMIKTKNDKKCWITSELSEVNSICKLTG